MITQALYERVIIELEEKDTSSEQLLDGVETISNDIIIVKVLDWGTLTDGQPFPFPAGLEVGMQEGTKMTALGNNRFLVDRRYILGIK